MRIRLLGHVAVVAGDPDGRAREVAVPGTAQRALLARLALAPGRPVGVERLADDLWDGAPPDGAERHLQVRASRLRRVLDEVDVALRFAAGGYVLDVADDDVDLHRHAGLVAAAEEAGPEEALALLDVADELWGPPLEEFRLRAWALPEVEVAERTATRGRLRRAACLLATGRGAQAVDLCVALVAADPLAAPPVELLMHALWQRGDDAAALAAFRTLRDRLADEGLDPPESLAALQARILRRERPPSQPAGEQTPPDVTRAPAPTPRGRLLGRDADLAALGERLAADRLVTLWGPGGIGKTSLARAAAADLAASGRRVHWVELAGASDPARLADHVRVGLGLAQDDDPITAVAAWARGRPVHVVLDNLEHLVDGAGELTGLLAAAPSVSLLVTSRVPLGVPDEVVVEVGPLPGGASDAPAVVMLRDVPGGVVWPDDALARLADALDRVPLALELVRTRLHAVAPDDLMARLGSSLDVLRDGTGDRPDRQRSMRGTLAWSRDLLGEDGRAVLDALGACRGPVDLPTLEAIARPEADVVTGCAELAAVALLRPDPDAPGTTYHVAGAVRAYAQECLAAAPDADEIHDRHAAHVRALARAAAADRTGPGQTAWLEALPGRHDDLLAAHAHLVAAGRPVEAAALLADVAWYWRTLEVTADLLRLAPTDEVAARLDADARVALAVGVATSRLARGDHDGATTEVDAAAAIVPADRPTLHARLDTVRAEHAIRDGRPADALALADAAATALREHGTAFDAADAVARAVIAAWHLGDLDTALARTRRALRLHREAGSAWGVAMLSNNLAYLLALQGDLDTAERLSAEALAMLPGLRTTADRADVADTAAVVAILHGDHELALDRLDQTRRLLDRVADRSTLPLVLAREAQVHAARGDLASARGAAQQAAAVARELGTDVALLFAADGVAVVLAAIGHPQLAADLAAAADARRQGSFEERLNTMLRDRGLVAHGVAVPSRPHDDTAADPGGLLAVLVEEGLDLLDQR